MREFGAGPSIVIVVSRQGFAGAIGKLWAFFCFGSFEFIIRSPLGLTVKNWLFIGSVRLVSKVNFSTMTRGRKTC